MANKNLFVGNIADGTTEQELADVFQPYGLVRFHLHNSGRYGFAEVPEDKADQAIADLNNKKVKGREINVAVATPKGDAKNSGKGNVPKVSAPVPPPPAPAAPAPLPPAFEVQILPRNGLGLYPGFMRTRPEGETKYALANVVLSADREIKLMIDPRHRNDPVTVPAEYHELDTLENGSRIFFIQVPSEDAVEVVADPPAVTVPSTEPETKKKRKKDKAKEAVPAPTPEPKPAKKTRVDFYAAATGAPPITIILDPTVKIAEALKAEPTVTPAAKIVAATVAPTAAMPATPAITSPVSSPATPIAIATAPTVPKGTILDAEFTDIAPTATSMALRTELQTTTQTSENASTTNLRPNCEPLPDLEVCIDKYADDQGRVGINFRTRIKGDLVKRTVNILPPIETIFFDPKTNNELEQGIFHRIETEESGCGRRLVRFVDPVLLQAKFQFQLEDGSASCELPVVLRKRR